MDRSIKCPRPRDVIVIHETDGRKYFEALVYLEQTGSIHQVRFVGASVLWRLAHLLIREKRSVKAALSQIWQNLKFRMTFLRIRNQIIVLAVAPWDPRFLLYSLLRFRNTMVYQTSWPFWTGRDVPRKVGPATALSRYFWCRILKEDAITIVAVTSDAARSVSAAVGRRESVLVIPHVVSQTFFQVRATHRLPIRLIFVGDLIERKGVRLLPGLLELLKDDPVTIELVGDGPLRSIAEQMASRPGCRWHGRITNREELAQIVGACQIFVSPALKIRRWEELFGMSIVEAMAAGVPCIASDHSGPRSVISHGRDGVLVREADLELMASWIKQLVRDADAWQALSERAVQTAMTYSMTAVSTAWEATLGIHPHPSLKARSGVART
jgi:glycosyltransferase involved in cell wall biosynthesis